MSAAVTSPGPSLPPGTVENSWRTPSIRMLVTAAPGMEESRVRRSELPMVYPKPGSRGSITNRERNSSTCSSVRAGRWAMSIFVPFRDARYMTVAIFVTAKRAPVARSATLLLRVKLNDELFLNLRVDLCARRERVHEDSHPLRHHIEPGRDLPLTRLRAGDEERRELTGLLANIDDVVVGDPVRRDVHLLAVDQEMAMAHQLAGHVAALRETRAVHNVVQPALKDLE